MVLPMFITPPQQPAQLVSGSAGQSIPHSMVGMQHQTTDQDQHLDAAGDGEEFVNGSSSSLSTSNNINYSTMVLPRWETMPQQNRQLVQGSTISQTANHGSSGSQHQTVYQPQNTVFVQGVVANQPQISPAEVFYQRMLELVNACLNTKGTDDCGLYGSAIHMFWYNTAGTVAWEAFSPHKRHTHRSTWKSQLMSPHGSPMAREVLVLHEEHLRTFENLVLIPPGPSTLQPDPKGDAIISNLFDILMHMLSVGERQDSNGVIPDQPLHDIFAFAGDHCTSTDRMVDISRVTDVDSMIEILCLVRIIWPLTPLTLHPTSKWFPTLAKFESQLRNEGYPSPPPFPFHSSSSTLPYPTISNRGNPPPPPPFLPGSRTLPYPTMFNRRDPPPPSPFHPSRTLPYPPISNGGKRSAVLPIGSLQHRPLAAAMPNVVQSGPSSSTLPPIIPRTDTAGTTLAFPAAASTNPTPADAQEPWVSQFNEFPPMPTTFSSLTEAHQTYRNRFKKRKMPAPKTTVAIQVAEMADVKSNELFWVGEVYSSLRQNPEHPTPRQQTAVKKLATKIEERYKVDFDLGEHLLALASTVVTTVIEVHEKGTDLLTETEEEQITFGGAKTSGAFKRDLELGIKDRLREVCKALRREKLIVADIFVDERMIARLAWRPETYQGMKEGHGKSNDNRAAKMKALAANGGDDGQGDAGEE